MSHAGIVAIILSILFSSTPSSDLSSTLSSLYSTTVMLQCQLLAAVLGRKKRSELMPSSKTLSFSFSSSPATLSPAALSLMIRHTSTASSTQWVRL